MSKNTEEQGISKDLAQKCLTEYNANVGKCWKLENKLGEGGFGTVFRVAKGKTDMAVKVARVESKLPCKKYLNCILPGVEKKWGCCHEVEMMRYLESHPNIVKLLDHQIVEVYEDTDQNITFEPTPFSLIFMPEYVDLEGYAASRKGITEEELRQIAVDICRALERCAEKFVFHCDVKGGNIFAEIKDGKTNFLLGDFGTATIVNPHNPKPVLFGATVTYVAPEIAAMRSVTPLYEDAVLEAAGGPVAASAYDPKLINADVFSLGATLYHMLSMELPDAHFKLGRVGRRLPKVSAAFEDIIRKAVRYNPHERYASAKEMRMDLEKLSASRETMVFEFSQFFQAKEYLLGNKLDQAERIARQGAKAGEARCELLLAYIHCIRVCREDIHDEWDAQTYLQKLKPVMAEVAQVYAKHKLPMARMLHGLMCLRTGYQMQFVQSMEQASEQDCIPAVFFWGRILECEENGCTGRREEGRKLLYRAAEMEYQPALRYVKRYLQRDYEEEFSDVLKTLLEPVDPKDPAQIFEGIVKYL